MARNSIAPGGYIGGEPPRKPTLNQLSGVWKLDDVLERQKNNAWTNVLGVEDVFSTWLYTGNGSTQTITNGIDLSGKGGLVWIKGRNEGTRNHRLFDTAQGATNFLESNTTNPQGSSAASLTSFGSSGFSIGASAPVNTSSDSYASWTFRKQAKFFDIATYTGTGSAQNITHSLGSAPGFMIIKCVSSSSNWICYHRSIDIGSAVFLNLVNTSTAATDITNVTSTSFSVDGSQTRSNALGQTYVAYLFAHDAGGFGDTGNESVIKCGSFITDGSGNATIDLGWEPQWVLIKESIASASYGWIMLDTMRGWDMSDANDRPIYANSTNAEATTFGGGNPTATGFVSPTLVASSTYIYIAIRRGPMKAPTDATKVFDVDAQSTSGFVSTGFPIDMTIAKERSVARGPFNVVRLLGDAYGATSSTGSFGSPGATPFMTFDSSVGGQSGLAAYYGAENGVFYNFRRAPGFFDVVAYAGSGAGQTVSHKLGTTPEIIIIKRRGGGTGNWVVNNAFGGVMYLDLANAQGSSTPWSFNRTPPTSTIFTTAETSNNLANAINSTYVAYLFASCPGVSKIGVYTGTGTTLNIDCGFANGARFVLIKRTDSTGDWYVWDTARGIIAANDPYLLLNSTAAEVTSTDYIDPLSSGFQISSTAPAAINANGGTYLYLAIA